jgi:cell division ATPase FtsA
MALSHVPNEVVESIQRSDVRPLQRIINGTYPTTMNIVRRAGVRHFIYRSELPAGVVLMGLD